MNSGYPSMTALLGLLAMAGYQNRDRIAEWIGGAQRNPGAPTQAPQSRAVAAPPGNLGTLLSGTSVGALLSDGLRELVDAFKQRAKEMSLIHGLVEVQTSRFLHHSWSRQSGPTY
jgi:hypothetical protein